MEGVILQTYGSGNFPNVRTDLLAVLKAACDRGVIIVNCTQCQTGHVTNSYKAGRVSYTPLCCVLLLENVHCLCFTIIKIMLQHDRALHSNYSYHVNRVCIKIHQLSI